jgi:isopentenyldiphosphate isomerase
VSECRDPGLELVDVIDQHGNVLATVTRREMRERRLLHRCVYILLFNCHGDVFIHLRTPAKDVFPSHWDVTVGGVLASGESFDQAAERELREELGVDATLESLFLFPYNDESTIVQGKVYRVRHDGPFRLQPEEIVRGEFVAVQEVLVRAATQPFCPDGLSVFEEYLRRELRTWNL